MKNKEKSLLKNMGRYVLRKSRRSFTALLLVVMTGLLSLPVSAAGGLEIMPGYILGGEVSGSTFTAEVYLRGANSTGGSIALQFDPSKLTLVDSSALTKAVSAGSGVTVSTSSLANELAVSQEDGRLLIGWYPSGLRLNASSEDKLVCTIPFNLKSGLTEDDLDAASLRMYDLRSGEFAGWECGAAIGVDLTGLDSEYVGEMRRYNIYSSPNCYVTGVYPGSDRTPADAREVTINVKDILDQPLEAEVMVGGSLYKTDSESKINLQLIDGTYSYKAVADGVDTDVKTFTVDGEDVTVDIVLRNDHLVAQRAANNLEIIYADGDSAERVTQSVTLPVTAEDRTYVFWNTDKPEVLANNGKLASVSEVTVVELTAIVMKNNAEAQRNFTLAVVPKGYQGALPDISEDDEPTGGESSRPVVGGGNSSTSGKDNAGTDEGKEPDTDEDKEPVDGEGEAKPQKNFTDLGDYSWAADAIHSLAAEGIINGVTETTFNPGGSITRADFTCLLMRMLLPEGELDNTEFPDVPQSAYYYNEVMRAKKLGIVTGSTDGSFNSTDNITRQDMVLITYRAMVALGNITAQEADDALDAFTDGESVQEYARLGVASAVENGWIQGAGNNELQPARNCTRAEAAVFIERINNK